MILGSRRFGMFFLAVAGTLFCLLIVSATSSGAQTRPDAQAEGATAAAGDDECVEFENEATGTGTDEDTGTDTGEDVATNTGEDTSINQQTTLQNRNRDSQQTQLNGDQQVQSQNENDVRQSQQNEDTGDQQAQQNGNVEDDGGPQALQYGEEDTTSPGTEGNINDECIIADTVPDKSLSATGAPVKSQADDKTTAEKEKKSDRGGKLESRSEKQKKSDQAKKSESRSEKQKKPDRSVKKIEIKNRGEKTEIEDRSGKEPRQERLKARSKSASTSDLAPVLAANWPRPTRTEVASANKPRRFTPGPGSEMTLSARALGIYDAPIASSGRPEDLDNGLIREPETSVPWDKGAQRNVYVAGHYLGNSGTASRLVFYNLHKLKKNDEIVLKDGWGQPYKYRVSESFAVGPGDSWVMGQVRNRDMLTLQTCIPPDFGKRLIVRADRVR